MIGHYIYLINCLAHDWMDKDVTRHMTEWSKMWPDTWLNGQRCDLTHDWMVKDVTWHMTEWSKMWPDTWLNGQRCDLTHDWMVKDVTWHRMLLDVSVSSKVKSNKHLMLVIAYIVVYS
jgi:hypothetical protein